jgi:integrase
VPDHLTKEQSRLYARRRRQEGHEVGPKDARRRKPTGNGTIIRELVTLRAALRWAVGQKWIASDPPIETPRAPPARDRWLTKPEAGRLLAAAQMPHVRLFIALALSTAARRGALLELPWAAVDLAGRKIDLGEGKGNKRRAVVPINDDLLPLLEEAKRGATTPYVIEFGGERIADVKTGLAAAARRAGLSNVTAHTFRHTAATWMAIDGVPLDDIAMFLGDNQNTVERVYRKHTPEYLTRAARALGGFSGKLAQETDSKKTR